MKIDETENLISVRVVDTFSAGYSCNTGNTKINRQSP